MKADLTRWTFEVARHYRTVRLQQGRVQLDADWNEQQDITHHRVEAETIDVVGEGAVPFGDDFLLTGNAGDVTIAAGHAYVHGVLCENDANTTVAAQPDWPPEASPILPPDATVSPMPPAGAAAATKIVVYDNAGNAQVPANGLYLGYVEVWQRHLTALEDDSMREVALGGPDTGTREKTVWQVKLLRVGDLGAPVTCASQPPEWTKLVAPPDGTMAARSEPTAPPVDDCMLSPQAGFRSLENLLYRVEIHDDGTLGKLRYKWSKDNGSIATRVVRWLNTPQPDEFEVASIGRDDRLAILAGCWVEFIDDTHELLGRPGTLVKVLKTAGNVVTVDLATATDSLDPKLFTRHPRVRRWDGLNDAHPAAPASAAGWDPLENGVEIKLAPGRYRIGDWWVVPARTATADVEWPRTAAGPSFLPPRGVPRAFMRLAVLSLSNGTWKREEDCRHQFPSLTELTNLYYVGGDGQEVPPDPVNPKPVPLPSPLRVAVLNGNHPVAGAVVRFKVSAGDLGGGALTKDVPTGTDGIALVNWSLDPTLLDQTATAVLLESGAPVAGKYATIFFAARLSTAKAVSYDPKNAPDLKALGIDNVQDAIDALDARRTGGGCCVIVGPGGDYPTLDAALADLVKKKQHDACVCLLPGDHALEKDVAIEDKGFRFEVHGAGRGSRLDLQGRHFDLTGLDAVTLRDFDVIDSVPSFGLRLRQVGEIRCDNLRVDAMIGQGSALSLDARQRLELRDCQVFVYSGDSLKNADEVMKKAPLLAPMRESTRTTRGEATLFAPIDDAVVKQFVALPEAQRNTLIGQIDALLQDTSGHALSAGTRDAFQRLKSALRAPKAAGMASALGGVRGAFAGDGLPMAVAAGGADADIVIEDCVINGRLAIGGEALQAEPTLDAEGAKLLGALLATGGAQLEPGNGTLRVTGCQLRAVRMSDAAATTMQAVLTKKNGAVTGLPDFALFEGNTFSGDLCEVYTANLSFTANVLRPWSDVGVFVATQAKYIGNFAFNDYRLWAVTQRPDEFGNGPLNLIPS